MPNKNYLAGRRMEWDCVARWRERGYVANRSAGSHGFWDVCAVKENRPVELIQCKVVGTVAEANRMLAKFRTHSALQPSTYFHQVLEVKVKGSTDILSVTV